MRPEFDNGTPVPAFLNKLWKMVDDVSTNDLITWSPEGNSFIIRHQGNFCALLLPQFYKHNNMASFVRQLNMYGFHKVSSVDGGGLRSDKDEIQFTHPYFKRDEPKLLEHIKRKMSSRMNTNESKTMEMMSHVLEDVAQMRGRQISLDTQLATMKRQNVALWRELSILRRKHHKQQQIVNKLIQFLVSFVQPPRANMNGLGVKRRYPLMINDVNGRPSKDSKLSATSETSGPTIHELDSTDTVLDDTNLLEDCIEPLVEIYSPQSTHNTNVRGNQSQNLETVATTTKKQNIESQPALDEIGDIIETYDYPLSPQQISSINITPTTSISTKQPSQSRTPNRNVKRTGRRRKNTQLTPPTDLLQEAENELNKLDFVTAAGVDPTILNPDNLVSTQNPTLSSSSTTALTQLLQDSATYNTTKEANETAVNSNQPSTSVTDDDMTLATIFPENKAYHRVNSAQEFDNHLESMQNDLDSLKDLLVSEGYSLDANALLGLFGTDDPATYMLPFDEATNELESSKVSSEKDELGSELMCAPMFDLLGMFNEPDNGQQTTSDNSLEAIDNGPLNTPTMESTYTVPQFPKTDKFP